jgi:S1-C subfamily serine protease
MFRSLATLSLALLLVLSLSVSGLAKRDLTKSVVPLQNDQYQTFCTAFSINEQEHLYMTAGHCAAYARDAHTQVWIQSGWAKLVFARFGDGEDIAIYQAQFGAPAVELAGSGVKVGDRISVLGYPYGLLKAIHVQGYVAGKAVPIGEGWPISDVLDITVAGGNSGSPVLNGDGDVIGLLWGGMTDSPHALSIPLEVLKRMTGGYWD